MGSKSKPETPKDKKKKLDPDIDPEEKVTELEKEFFTYQINDIEKKLVRLAEREERLKADKAEVEDKIEEFKKDKGNIVTMHEELLAGKEEEKCKKREEMLQLSEDIKIRTQNHQQSIQNLEEQYNKMIVQLTTTIEQLEEEIRILEDYKQNKAKYNEKLDNLEREMDEAEKEHQRNLFKIERKWENARGRVKKELQSRLLQLSIEFRQTSQRKIGKPCHRVTQENKAIHTALLEMKEEIHQYNEKEATAKEKIIELREHKNKRRDDKNKLIARTMLQVRVIKGLLKRQASLWMKLKAFASLDATNKLLLKKLHYVDSEIERKAAATERVKQDIEGKMESMSMMKEARRFLKKNVRKVHLSIRNALRIAEEAAAVKLIPIGELEEERTLNLEGKVRFFKKRRQSVFDRRGRIMQYLLEQLTKAQITEDDRKFLRTSSESVGLEQGTLSMIYGKSVHSLDRELEERESQLLTNIDDKGPFYLTSLTSLPRSVSTLVIQPVKKESEEESIGGESERAFEEEQKEKGKVEEEETLVKEANREGIRKSQEAGVGIRKSQEAGVGSRKSQETAGGSRKSQEIRKGSALETQRQTSDESVEKQPSVTEEVM